MGEITHLLRRIADGDDAGMERLLPLVYGELRTLARRHLRAQRPDHTLTPTALVHEAFLKLAGGENLSLKDRTHFFAVASNAMRYILVDHARRRLRQKRQARDPMVTFAGGAVQNTVSAVELVEIDIALEKLSALHKRQASVLELCFFGGLTHDETAVALRVSTSTVRRDLRFARAWLSRELQVA